MANLTDLEKEINIIKKRNEKVELDKKWETSYQRRFSIAIGTYFLCLLLLIIIGAQNPYLAAVVPSVGYLISTLSLSFLKSVYAKSFQ